MLGHRFCTPARRPADLSNSVMVDFLNSFFSTGNQMHLFATIFKRNNVRCQNNIALSRAANSAGRALSLTLCLAVNQKRQFIAAGKPLRVLSS
ncbi:hypothetical protein NPIL_350591 [Nephila pilipes]|uniref:Uncharacterized protein n=1 Tax=Nephila pilipes TaxID=299642 RepID=A0A8X6JW41_NEPPI|nr:hypothetical protein NPIL_350591 [Nephila pilipes]